jgi:hypothetical protein
MCNEKDRDFGATTTGSFIMTMCSHSSLKTTEYVTNNMVIVPHPPYSPDVAPCEFTPKLKMKLKGRFETSV